MDRLGNKCRPGISVDNERSESVRRNIRLDILDARLENQVLDEALDRDGRFLRHRNYLGLDQLDLGDFHLGLDQLDLGDFRLGLDRPDLGDFRLGLDQLDLGDFRLGLGPGVELDKLDLVVGVELDKLDLVVGVELDYFRLDEDPDLLDPVADGKDQEPALDLGAEPERDDKVPDLAEDEVAEQVADEERDYRRLHFHPDDFRRRHDLDLVLMLMMHIELKLLNLTKYIVLISFVTPRGKILLNTQTFCN
jgi:hypothetical protein